MNRFIPAQSVLDPMLQNDLGLNQEYSPQEKIQRRRPIKINISNCVTMQPETQSKPVVTPQQAENGFKGKRFLSREEVSLSSATTCPIDFEEAFHPRKLPNNERQFVRTNYLQGEEVSQESTGAVIALKDHTTTTIRAKVERKSERSKNNNEVSQQTPPAASKRRASKQSASINQVSDFSITCSKEREKEFIIPASNTIPEHYRKKSAKRGVSASQVMTNHTTAAGSRRSSKVEIGGQDSSQKIMQSQATAQKPSQIAGVNQQQIDLSQRKKSLTRGRRSDSFSSQSNCNTEVKEAKKKRIHPQSNSAESNVSRSGMKSCLNLTWDSRESLGPCSGGNFAMSRCLEDKIKKIFERKNEKAQIKYMQANEKAMKEELYGLFSRQSREVKQKRKQSAVTVAEILQRHLQLVTSEFDADLDSASKNRPKIDTLIKQSVESEIQKRREEEERAQRTKEERIKLAEKLESLKETIRECNKRSKSQESSLISKRIAWGADQQRMLELEQKRRMAIEYKRNERKSSVVTISATAESKIIQQNSDYSSSTMNETVSKKRYQVNQQQQREKSVDKVKKGTGEKDESGENEKHSTIIQGGAAGSSSSNPEYEAILRGRVEKIVKEQRKASEESRFKKEQINQRLSEIEEHRKQGFKKCKRVPFQPTEAQIASAFKFDD